MKRKDAVMRTFVSYWLPPILWTALIFYLSSLSSLPNFEDFDFTVKKAAHFAVYAFLYLLLVRAFRSTTVGNGTAVYWPPILAVPVAILYAISDEIHQSFLPFRTATIRDVLIDTAGITSMYLLMKVRLPLFRRILGQPAAPDHPGDQPPNSDIGLKRRQQPADEGTEHDRTRNQ
jgi:VanZ family protein